MKRCIYLSALGGPLLLTLSACGSQNAAPQPFADDQGVSSGGTATATPAVGPIQDSALPEGTQGQVGGAPPAASNDPDAPPMLTPPAGGLPARRELPPLLPEPAALPAEWQQEQVTFGPKHHFYGYQGHVGNTPFNRSGTHLALLETDFQDRYIRADDIARVMLLELKTHTLTELAQTRAWNFQQGSMMYWHPLNPDEELIFNDREAGTQDVKTVLLNVNTRERREYYFPQAPIGNAGVAQRGGKYLGLNYGRLDARRPVTGYKGARDWTEGAKVPSDDGVWVVDMFSGEAKLIVSYADVAKQFGAGLGDFFDHVIFINHTLWSRDDSRIYFVMRYIDGERIVNAPFTCRADGSDLRAAVWPNHADWQDGTHMMFEGGSIHDMLDGSVTTKAPTMNLGEVAISRGGNWVLGRGESHISLFSRQHNQGIQDMVMGERGSFTYKGETAVSSLNRIDLDPCWNANATAFYHLSLDKQGTRQAFVVNLKHD